MTTATFDLVVRDGVVVDGTGAAATPGDVAVSGGRIVGVGAVDGRGRHEIDAAGRVVAPGFIDVHTHYDAQLFWDPACSPSPFHGVTSVVAGNCGFSIAPLDPASAPYLLRLLARVEGMPIEALRQGVPWDWTTTGDFLDRVGQGLAVNAGFMVGHSAVRRFVLGEASSERAATDAEVEAMAALVRAGLDAGALGFSSSWSTTHNDAEGRPVPSRFASADEVVRLAAVCREFDGTSLEFVPKGGPIDAEDEALMIAMSVASGRSLNWNLLVASAERLDDCLQKLAVGTRAAEAGGHVVGLTMPVPPVLRLSFLTGFVLDSIPGWEELMALPPADRRARLADPAERLRLDDLARRGPRPQLARWEERMIGETFAPGLERYRGRLVGDIAAEEGTSPFDALLDIVVADDLRTIFLRTEDEPTAADWAARERIWRDPRTMLGGSDAGAHLDFISTFNYTTWLLEHACRGRGLLPLEEAIGMLTDRPARLYGLHDRGRVAVGTRADLVVLDPDTVGCDEVHTRFDLPGGAGRLYGEATGIGHVIVGGTEVVVDGALTDERPGVVLRSGTDTRTGHRP